MHDGFTCGRHSVTQCVTFPHHAFEGGDHARGGIQTYPIAKSAIFIGIIGDDDCHPALTGLGLAEARPRRRQFSDKINARRYWLMLDHGHLGRLIKLDAFFERNRPGDQPAIDFR